MSRKSIRANVRRNAFACRTCQDAKLKDEASAHGLTLLGAGEGRYYRTYRFDACGHEQEIRTSDVRIGNFTCRTCNESVWDGPGYVYLFRLMHPTIGEALKVGLSKNPKSRAIGIGPRDGVTVTEIDSRRFDSYREAHAFEQAIHTRMKRKRLPIGRRARDFVMNGFTELLQPNAISHLGEFVQAHQQMTVTGHA